LNYNKSIDEAIAEYEDEIYAQYEYDYEYRDIDDQEPAVYLAGDLVQQIKDIALNCTPELEARIQRMLKQEFPEEML